MRGSPRAGETLAGVAAPPPARHLAADMLRRVTSPGIAPSRGGVALALLAFAATGVAPARLEAQDAPHRLEWSDEYRRADVGLVVATGTMSVGAIVADLLYRPDIPWPGFEPGLEDRLAGILEDRPDARRRVRLAGRLLGLAASLQAKLVDPAFVVWAGDRNRDVAGQMYALNALSLATVALTTALLTPTARRPRPSFERCLADPEYDPSCGEADEVRSLVDARLAVVMTSAALTCTHHAHLPLYGEAWADRAGCAGAAILAGTSGLLAFLADRQHPTDVLAAAVLGLAAGFVLPSVVGYRAFE